MVPSIGDEGMQVDVGRKRRLRLGENVDCGALNELPVVLNFALQTLRGRENDNDDDAGREVETWGGSLESAGLPMNTPHFHSN